MGNKNIKKLLEKVNIPLQEDREICKKYTIVDENNETVTCKYLMKENEMLKLELLEKRNYLKAYASGVERLFEDFYERMYEDGCDYEEDLKRIGGFVDDLNSNFYDLQSQLDEEARTSAYFKKKEEDYSFEKGLMMLEFVRGFLYREFEENNTFRDMAAENILGKEFTPKQYMLTGATSKLIEEMQGPMTECYEEDCFKENKSFADENEELEQERRPE